MIMFDCLLVYHDRDHQGPWVPRVRLVCPGLWVNRAPQVLQVPLVPLARRRSRSYRCQLESRCMAYPDQQEAPALLAW